MATVVTPVGKVVYLCDDVLLDPDTGKVRINGVFNSWVPPPGSVYPYRPEQLCVAATVTGGLGEMPVVVEVVQASTGQIIHRSAMHTVRLATRHSVLVVCVRLKNCWFPAPGEYFVEVYCNHEFVDDRRLLLQPLEGDLYE